MGKYAYKRVLLKLSGEALAGSGGLGIDAETVTSLAKEIASLARDGVQLAVVIGGGNMFRGGSLTAIERNEADKIGMLATVMNSLFLRDALTKEGCSTVVMSALAMPEVCETYVPAQAIAHLNEGAVVLCAAGTGNSFFTTDTTAALRACQVHADIVLKATKVDGVYDSDPKKNPDAVRFERTCYAEVLQRGLKVMDSTATSLCMDNAMPIVVFDMTVPGNIVRVLRGENIGTVVSMA